MRLTNQTKEKIKDILQNYNIKRAGIYKLLRPGEYPFANLYVI